MGLTDAGITWKEYLDIVTAPTDQEADPPKDKTLGPACVSEIHAYYHCWLDFINQPTNKGPYDDSKGLLESMHMLDRRTGGRLFRAQTQHQDDVYKMGVC